MTYIDEAIAELRRLYGSTSPEELETFFKDKLVESFKNGIMAGKARAGGRGGAKQGNAPQV